MKTKIWVVVVAVVLMTGIVAMIGKADQSVVEQTAVAPVESKASIRKGSHLLEWGVLAYAVGEVAGLLGRGMCEIRKERRAEMQEIKEFRELPLSNKVKSVKAAVRKAKKENGLANMAEI